MSGFPQIEMSAFHILPDAAALVLSTWRVGNVGSEVSDYERTATGSIDGHRTRPRETIKPSRFDLHKIR